MASISEPHVDNGDSMPSDLAAALEANDALEDEKEDTEAEDRSAFEECEEAELLNAEQIESLGERLQEIVVSRPSELTDARTDPQVQAAVNILFQACNGDAEITFAVVSVWFNNNGL